MNYREKEFDQILDRIRKGTPVDIAVRACGVDLEIFKSWCSSEVLKRKVDRAEAEFVSDLIKIATERVIKDKSAEGALRILQLRYPKDFQTASRQTREV